MYTHMHCLSEKPVLRSAGMNKAPMLEALERKRAEQEAEGFEIEELQA